jgi:hypothetical protein
MKRSTALAAALVAIAAFGGWAAGYAASRTVYFYDAIAHADYLAAYRLPIHVVQQAAPGWNVVFCVWGVLAALAAVGAAFARSLSHLGRRALGILFAAQALTAFALIFFPIVQAGDVYAYVVYGRLYGHYGANPYQISHPLSGADPIFGPILPFLSATPFGDPYGPLWTIIAGFIGKIDASAGLGFMVYVYRGLGAISLLATTAAIAYTYRSFGRAQAATRAAIFGLHPLALYESVVGAHNDMLMLAPALWAFAIADSFPFAAALLAGASIAIKLPAIIGLPFLLRRIGRTHGWAWVAALFIACAVPWLCGRAFPSSTAGNAATLGSAFSMSVDWLANIPIFTFGLGSGPAFPWLQALPFFGAASWPRLIQIAVLASSAVIGCLGLIRYVLRPRSGEIWRTVTAFLWSLSSMHPWYGQWLLPAVAGGGRWATYAWWYGALLAGIYALDGVAATASAHWVPVTLCLAFLIIPVMVARSQRAIPPGAGA